MPLAGNESQTITADTVRRAFDGRGLCQLGPVVDPDLLPPGADIINREPLPIDITVRPDEIEYDHDDELKFVVTVGINHADDKPIDEIFEEVDDKLERFAEGWVTERYHITSVGTINFDDLEQQWNEVRDKIESFDTWLDQHKN
jgi:hypothetical protein